MNLLRLKMPGGAGLSASSCWTWREVKYGVRCRRLRPHQHSHAVYNSTDVCRRPSYDREVFVFFTRSHQRRVNAAARRA